jgi:hypothetical protein
MYIVNKFLYYAIIIKLYHWTTMKYSRHKATDDLHASIQSGMDKFIEVYIGIYGRKEVFKGKSTPIDLTLISDRDAINTLDDICDFLQKELPRHLDKNKSNTDLLNIRDEILANINQAKYLFTLD